MQPTRTQIFGTAGVEQREKEELSVSFQKVTRFSYFCEETLMLLLVMLSLVRDLGSYTPMREMCFSITLCNDTAREFSSLTITQ